MGPPLSTSATTAVTIADLVTLIPVLAIAYGVIMGTVALLHRMAVVPRPPAPPASARCAGPPRDVTGQDPGSAL
ncbi:MAG: hypothetical protein ACRDTT_34850 [Pseudonocardiaceae bacterium]